MPDLIRLTGMPQAIPDGDTKDIHFVLEAKDNKPLYCVADYGIASEISSGLGSALRLLRAALAAKGSVVSVLVEHLSAIQVERSLLGEEVVLTVTTEAGIPYLFQIPIQVALGLSDELRTAAMKENPMGNA